MTALGPRAEGAGFRIALHDALASTMDEAMARARAGDDGKLWIVADRQTAGRGRHGRVWTSEPGNLYATLLLKNPCPRAMAPQLGFVAGLALRDALVALTSLGDRIRLKWPNDVLVDGAKLSGILLEGASVATASGKTTHVVAIGVGVNVAHHPDDLPYPATDLAALGYRLHPHEVLAQFADMMTTRLAQWAAGQDFALVRGAWLTVAANLRQTVQVAVGDRVLRGVFTGLDATGRMLLATDEGPETIDAGDMMHRREAA